MKRSIFLILLLTITAFSGCISSDEADEPESSENVKVMTTIVPLGHFVKMVGGDKVNVDVLVRPGSNPHTFEPSPSQLMKIEETQIYVKNGAGLEIWMDRIIRANEDMLVVDSSEGIDLIESAHQDYETERGGAQDREYHENIRTADPHIWLSPKNAMIQVENICRGLIEVDPENAEYYLNNRDDYLQRLKDLDRELENKFSGAERNKFVVLHPSWSYFARDYGLEQIPVLLTEKEPGPRYLATIIETARENEIETVFADPNFNPKSAEIVANEIGGKVVPLDPLKENYLENMRHVGQEIAASLNA